MMPLSLRLCAITLACWASCAIAGPPFVSDDPEPTEPGRWEIYGFAAGAHVEGGTDGGAGLDINYGGGRDLQLTAVVPLNYAGGSDRHVGVGNVEIAVKYKFLHQREGSFMPDVAVFPRAFTPTAGRRFGTRRLSLLLPLWAQKDFGEWAVFGGGGYDINPGRGQRNFWLTGIGLSRAVGDRLSMGAEIYRQTADAVDSRTFTAVNFGATLRLTPHWSLLGAAGPGVEHSRNQGLYSFYAALKADY